MPDCPPDRIRHATNRAVQEAGVMAEAVCKLQIVDGVGQILFDRPEALNAMDGAMLEGFRNVAIVAATDPAIKVVTIRGQGGKAFSAGGDVGLMARCSPEDRQAMILKMAGDLHEGQSILLRSGKPVIAGVRGVAAGAGFSVVLSADLVVAAEDARFTLAYTKMGLTPDGGGSFFLQRVVGSHRAMELMLTNRMLSANDAADWGIVNRLCGSDAVDAELQAWAAELAAGPAAALQRAKSVMADDLLRGLEQHLSAERNAIAFSTTQEEFQTRVTAFLAKQGARA
jgi:2-(1,2-epoxy-1,2-dihydrophenyl)acetyl-CoA isomerase